MFNHFSVDSFLSCFVSVFLSYFFFWFIFADNFCRKVLKNRIQHSFTHSLSAIARPIGEQFGVYFLFFSLRVFFSCFVLARHATFNVRDAAAYWHRVLTPRERKKHSFRQFHGKFFFWCFVHGDSLCVYFRAYWIIQNEMFSHYFRYGPGCLLTLFCFVLVPTVCSCWRCFLLFCTGNRARICSPFPWVFERGYPHTRTHARTVSYHHVDVQCVHVP